MRIGEYICFKLSEYESDKLDRSDKEKMGRSRRKVQNSRKWVRLGIEKANLKR